MTFFSFGGHINKALKNCLSVLYHFVNLKNIFEVAIISLQSKFILFIFNYKNL